MCMVVVSDLIVCYYTFRTKQIQKASTYNEPLAPIGKPLMIRFIFNIGLNKVTDTMALAFPDRLGPNQMNQHAHENISR